MSDYSDSFDSSYDTTFEVTTIAEPYAEIPTFDPGFAVEETGSYSYDSTDWSAVAETSEVYMDNYDSLSDASWDAYNAGVEAWLNGDSEAAYDLNQLSIGLEGSADTAWDQAGDVWSTNELTTVSTYESVDSSYAVDPGYSADSYSYTADTTSYDTSSYSVDTSSYSSSYSVDTSSSYSADTSSDW
ncbi:MAG: hypothetical protein ABMA25_00240 [Ilumatobacteraceae bacterium]